MVLEIHGAPVLSMYGIYDVAKVMLLISAPYLRQVTDRGSLDRSPYFM